jgi:hypothetical protein
MLKNIERLKVTSRDIVVPKTRTQLTRTFKLEATTQQEPMRKNSRDGGWTGIYHGRHKENKVTHPSSRLQIAENYTFADANTTIWSIITCPEEAMV